MKIAHISDVHIRLKDRHEEYLYVFKNLYKSLKDNKPDRILLAGDIVHSKISMSPELIMMFRGFLKNLEEIAPVDIIVGNHDMNVSNVSRLDAISPIVSSITTTGNGIFYYKDSGVVKIGDSDFYYGVFSMMDGKTPIIENRDKDSTYIALYHGPVAGCVLDNGFVFDSASMMIDEFSDFDFVMLGDIHRRQFLRENKTAAYAGSLIQQTFGEEIDKGYMLWDIKSNDDFSCDFVKVDNQYGFATIHASNGVLPDLVLPQKCRVRVIWEKDTKDISRSEITRLNSIIREKYSPFSIQIVFKPKNVGSSRDIMIDNKKNLADADVQRGILKSWFSSKTDHSEYDIDGILKLDDIIGEKAKKSEDVSSGINWCIKSMEIENFMSYGEKVKIDFDNMLGIIGLFGNNAVGKSVILDAISYVLFNKTTRKVKNSELANKYTGNNTCSVSVNMDIDGTLYRIDRKTTKFDKEDVRTYTKTIVSISRKLGDHADWEDISGGARLESETIIRDMVGNFNDFLLTTLSTSSSGEEFIDQTPSVRSDNMLRFLGLDIYSRKHQIAKDMSKSIKQEMDNINANDKLEEVGVIRKELTDNKGLLKEDGVKIKDVNAKIKVIKAEIKKINNSIDGSINIDKPLCEIKEEHDRLETDLLKVEEEKKELYADYLTYVDRLKKLESVLKSEKEIRDLTDEKCSVDDIKNKIEDMRSDIRSDKKLLMLYRKDIIRGNHCPVSYDENHVKCEYLISYTDKKNDCISLLDKVEKKQKNVNKMTEDISNAANTINEFDFQTLVLAEIQKISSELDDCRKKTTYVNSVLESKKIIFKLISSKLRVASENEEILGHDLDAKKLRGAKEDILSGLQSDKEDLLSHSMFLEKTIVGLEKDVEYLEKDIEKYELLNKKYDIYHAYVIATHRDSIPMILLKEFIPHVNFEMNNMLSSIINFNVFLKLDDMSTVIDIVMRYDGDIDDTRSAQMASGMEKLLINMVIRYALISVSALSKPDIWIIDEGFGVLDEENLSSISKFFENARSIFKNIIIVTHIDALKDIAQWVINIEKKDGISIIGDPIKNI